MKTETKQNIAAGVLMTLSVFGCLIYWTLPKGTATDGDGRTRTGMDASQLEGTPLTTQRGGNGLSEREYWEEHHQWMEEILTRGIVQLMERNGMDALCVTERDQDWVEMEGGGRWKPGLCLYPVEFPHMNLKGPYIGGAVMITIGPRITGPAPWRDIEVDWWPEKRVDGRGLGWTGVDGSGPDTGALTGGD